MTCFPRNESHLRWYIFNGGNYLLSITKFHFGAMGAKALHKVLSAFPTYICISRSLVKWWHDRGKDSPSDKLQKGFFNSPQNMILNSKLCLTCFNEQQQPLDIPTFSSLSLQSLSFYFASITVSGGWFLNIFLLKSSTTWSDHCEIVSISQFGTVLRAHQS